MTKKFDLLKEFQDVDLEIDRLKKMQKNLPEKQQCDEIKQKLEGTKEGLIKKSSKLQEEISKQNKTEGEIDLLNQKIERENSKLFNGKVINSKELSSLQEEIKQLEKRKDEMETELLGQLEIVDNLEPDTKQMEEKINQMTDRLKTLERNFQVALKEKETKLKQLAEEKNEVQDKIPSDLLAVYESIKKENKEVPIVSIKDGICQGCNIGLPAEEVDKMMKKDNELWRCFNCGRILSR